MKPLIGVRESFSISRYLNDNLKAECDDYDNNAEQKRDCSVLLKLEKNDKMKFRLAGRAYYYTTAYRTSIEGFMAVPLH